MVPDVNEACERFEQLGVEFVKRPNDGRMKGLAFIKDPDGKYFLLYLKRKPIKIINLSIQGYWIEIFNPNPMFPDPEH